MEAGAETEAEEQRGDVEYWTIQITEVGRVNFQLSTIGTETSAPLSSAPGWNPTTRL